MPTRVRVPEEDYLSTFYEPACEYWDGELVERNAGEFAHSFLQGLLNTYFGRRRKAWNILVCPELRFRTRPGRYLIPDLAILTGPEPVERVPSVPPLIWIEILSPEDRPVRVNQKVREVLDFGVPYVWVIDPENLESILHTPHNMAVLTDGVLRIPNTPIEVPLQALAED